MTANCDIAIVGAGMAGASLAAALSPHCNVVIVEAEDAAGYHATGRSAAFWEETYGGPGVYPLTAASGPYLRDGGFLSPRGALNIGRDADRAKVEAFVDQFAPLGAGIECVGRDRMLDLVPGLLPGWNWASWEPACADIDVAGLHAHYLAVAKRNGAVLRVRAGLTAVDATGGGWTLSLSDGTTLSCRILANAAGAWADGVARMAGARPVGITPLRRTVAQLRTDPAAPGTLPLVLDINERFYFKPESGRLWLSPHDETPSAPCDAAAEEIDVAHAIARFEDVVDWRVKAVERRWAGLRSFAPDRLPVYGFDPAIPGFFWCAGQGGFGIQTAPAGAALAARLVLGGAMNGAHDIAADLDPAPYAPDRFAR